jgi:hypothetical protein
MKISPVGAELFHADRRTDVHDEAVAFRNFAKAPKNVRNFSEMSDSYNTVIKVIIL